VKQLLSKARSRVIGHLVLDKGALALVIGLGAFIVLLLIGTQVLEWYWPVLIAAVSLGVGVYQLRKNVPSTYEVAQRIDHRLELADSLSTAFYFSEHPKPGFEAVCAAQYRSAEQLAAGVNLPQALPLPRSRYLLPAGGLLLAATALFGVRYFMIGSLDLKASLLEAVADTFFSSTPEEIAKNAPKDHKQGAFDPSKPALPATPEEEKQIPPDFDKGQNMSPGKENQQQNSTGDEKGPGKGDEQNSNDQQGDQNSPPQDKQGDKGREGDDKNAAQPQGTDQKSLLDKLRDGLNNLMNKMGSNDQKQSGQKGGEKQQAKQDKNGKGDDSKSSDDAQADKNQNGQDGKQQDSQKSANAPGQKPSDQAASGAGENDGKKALEEAKMLEAMGKLNELIGERSNQITGDMTVEVGSSTQQLKTELTQQKAGHTDAGGEIHRDQVPLADQLFVEQYFKEVRKSGGVAAKPSAGAPSGSAKGNGKAAAKSDTTK
jgi:hypothetical protein